MPTVEKMMNDVELRPGRRLYKQPRGRCVFKRSLLALACASVLTLILQHAYAFTPLPPTPHRYVVGENDQYLLVLLLGEGDWRTFYNLHGEPYPSSGLYRNDGSVEPLWTVDNYTGRYFLANDGEHLAVLLSADDLQMPGLWFLNRGQKFREYKVGELVGDPRKMYDSFWGGWTDSVVFDARRNLLAIETVSGEFHLFDVATGELIVSTRSDLRLSGELHMSSDRTIELKSLRICWGSQMLIGTDPEDAASNGKRIQALPLRDVAHLQRVRSERGSTLRLEVELARQGTRTIEFDGRPPQLCGEDTQGMAVTIDLDDVTSMKVTAYPASGE